MNWDAVWAVCGMLATYGLGRARGYRKGVDRGYIDATDADAQRSARYWPTAPPAVIMYSGKPHMENDCGGACVKYVRVDS